MSNAIWPEQFAIDCELAAHKCTVCRGYGHQEMDCPRVLRAAKEAEIIRITEVPESKLVGRAETGRFLFWALGLFWLAVGLAALWRKL